MNANCWIPMGRLSIAGAVVLTAGLASSPTSVSAEVIHVRARVHGHGRAPAVYETRARLVTVPVLYERRLQRVWREPLCELRRVAEIVPARVVVRRVPRYSIRGRRIGYTTVRTVVEPARRVWRTKRVLVRPGYYETVYRRVCVRPATTKPVRERVLVRPGHRVRPIRGMLHTRGRLPRRAGHRHLGGLSAKW